MLEAFRPEDRGKAMGFWGLGIVVAPMLGPVLGGWLTDNYSWRWVFYINIPVAILCTFLIRTFVFDPPYLGRAGRVTVDYAGIGFLVMGVGALQVMLDKGQQEDWFESNFIRILFVLTIIGFGAFILRELTTRTPIVDLRVFRERTYSAGVLLMTMVGFVLYGSLVLLPVFLQTLLGYPALEAGIAMAPRGLGSFIAMPMVGMIAQRFDPRKLLVLGITGTAFTLYDLSRLNLNAGYWNIFWPQFFQGMAMSLLFVPLTTATMSPIPREQMGNATSLFNFMRNIGGSIGIAMTTTILARSQQQYGARLGEHASAWNPQTTNLIETMRRGFMAQGSDQTTATSQAYASLYGMLQGQAAMLSFIHLFQLLALTFLCMLPLLLVMRRPKVGAPVVAAH
jgi:MFS transporter, DHA2 family, multidrug resistance protein